MKAFTSEEEREVSSRRREKKTGVHRRWANPQLADSRAYVVPERRAFSKALDSQRALSGREEEKHWNRHQTSYTNGSNASAGLWGRVEVVLGGTILHLATVHQGQSLGFRGGTNHSSREKTVKTK